MSDADELTTAQLLTQLSEQSSALVRQEVRLAQLELQEKGKRAGLGIGLLGGGGVIGLYGVGALIATVILLLATAVAAWLAALIVTVVLFAAGGVAALLGKNKVAAAGPPVPAHAVDSTRADVESVKEAAHR